MSLCSQLAHVCGNVSLWSIPRLHCQYVLSLPMRVPYWLFWRASHVDIWINKHPAGSHAWNVEKIKILKLVVVGRPDCLVLESGCFKELSKVSVPFSKPSSLPINLYCLSSKDSCRKFCRLTSKLIWYTDNYSHRGKGGSIHYNIRPLNGWRIPKDNFLTLSIILYCR